MNRRPRSGAPPRIYPPSIVVKGAELGPDVVVGAFCFVACGAAIGAGTRLQGHSSVWAGVVLGQDVFVGPGAQFTNVRHPRAAFPRAPHWDRTWVEDGATVGAHATLVAPLHIGRCAMIGAGAVVTRDVPAHAIVVGNPARISGWACACGETIAKGAHPPAPPLQCAMCRRASAPPAAPR
ncbi:MAG: acyltransferase [Polyangiaceae bacterium]|jgi:UDP-2-acetamido-3-amino-2,3-dideoxy-glucuronate N-acetyltransferase